MVDATAGSRAIKGQTLPRRRKRKASTAGALNDCFSCQELQVDCDRTRPYCSQCIERGKTCSGYKTTLTWGMGVASRGKLRGLKLPVTEEKQSGAGTEGSITNTGDAANHPDDDTRSQPLIASDAASVLTAHEPTNSNPTVYDFVNFDPNGPQRSPTPPLDTASKSTDLFVNKRRAAKRKLRTYSLQPLSLPTRSPDLSSPAPMTAGFLGNLGEMSFEQAIGSSPTSSPLTSTPHSWTMPRPKLEQTGWEMDAASKDPHGLHYRAAWQPGTLTANVDPKLGGWDFINSRYLDGERHGPEGSASTTNELAADPQERSLSGIYHKVQAGAAQVLLSSSDVPSNTEHPFWNIAHPMTNGFIGGTPQMRELIQYYDQVISPVIVAFDGSKNPYRQHVIRLASGSETLQNAIAALAASNLRMRRGIESSSLGGLPYQAQMPHQTSHDASVRKSTSAHNKLRQTLGDIPSESGVGTPSPQELHFKAESIRILNDKLANPAVRDDDDILATLLVLCLYHICTTGVARFRTHFAGVKRVLELRKKKGGQETRWLVTMFCWLDAMTATVNDREAQFEPSDEDTSDLGPDEWALENLAGCDARLFRIISKLGRLNLLSRDMAGVQDQYGTTAPRGFDYYSLNSVVMENSFQLRPQVPLSATQISNDPAARFRMEWSRIRQELSDWTFLPSSIPPSMRSSLDGAALGARLLNDIDDLQHISESFRYAALIYIERLANPQVSASAPNFQDLVTCAMQHIRAVRSDVYLLWPLFVTGAECVRAEHRELVRKRCLAIQEDSGFFNNMNTLNLLQRIWQCEAGQPAGSLATGCGRSASRWRAAMDNVDGEYIVI